MRYYKNIFFIFIGLFLLTSFNKSNQPVKHLRKKNIVRDSIKNNSNVIDSIFISNEFNKTNLISYMKELNIRFPRVVLAQAILESGHFKSKLVKNNNNLFGFRQAKKRKTTSLGSRNGYAYYNSWKDCVFDYYLYSERYLSHIKTEEEYLRYLNKHYSETKNYSLLLRKVMKKIKI